MAVPKIPPPIRDRMIDDRRICTQSWMQFFNRLIEDGGGGVGAPSFGVLSVLGYTSIDADVPTDTLIFSAGSGIIIETDPLNKTVTFRTSSSLGPAPPDTSVQFNDGGAFGGNAAFEFKKDVTTVTVGTGHAVGATGSFNVLIGEGHTVL